jgi:hypothetical protein
MRLYTASILAATAFSLAAPGVRAEGIVNVYSDPDGRSVANVAEVLPNSTPQTEVFTHVSSVDLLDSTYIIHWEGGAISLLSRQYVINITINKRNVPATPSPR